MRRGATEPTPERREEVERILERVRDLSLRRRDVVAVALVGSWARGEAGMESDLDLIVLTTEKEFYLRDETWMRALGGVEIIRTQDWGPLYTERRFITKSGLVVEFGVAPPEWAATVPPNLETSGKVADGGLQTVHDPDGVLKRFIAARESSAG